MGDNGWSRAELLRQLKRRALVPPGTSYKTIDRLFNGQTSRSGLVEPVSTLLGLPTPTDRTLTPAEEHWLSLGKSLMEADPDLIKSLVPALEERVKAAKQRNAAEALIHKALTKP